MKSSYFLTIPKQTDNPQRLRAFETKALQHWIDEIPAANPSLASRLVHDLLSEFNTLKMSPRTRLAGLEQLKASVHVIEDYLRDQLLKSGFPKEPAHLKILQLLAGVEQAFAAGYWIALKELNRRGIGWLQFKPVTLALQRTIKGLNSVIVSYFLMDRPVPEWVWIDLHALYKLSVKLNSADAKPADDFFFANRASTPAECYRQILLLSLADPTGLMQREILQVYYFIETLSPLVEFSDRPIAGQSCQCVVLADEDQPPFFQTDSRELSGPGLLFIDFTRLYQAFKARDKIKRSPEGRFSASYGLIRNSEQPSAELADYLYQRWSGRKLQGACLFGDRLDRYMTIGLDSAFNLQKPSGKTECVQENRELLVQSESDRLLTGVFGKPGMLSVGSLVSLRKTDGTDKHRLLGIVNKLDVSKPANKLIFGIELLAAQSLAVLYYLAGERSELPQRGLFYAVASPVSASYLVTDNSLLKENDSIRMVINRDHFTIVLKNKTNIGLGYWRFGCFKAQDRTTDAGAAKTCDFG